MLGSYQVFGHFQYLKKEKNHFSVSSVLKRGKEVVDREVGTRLKIEEYQGI